VCSSGACCTPKTCSDLAKTCGVWSDTCGGNAQCAPCAHHQECADGTCLLNVLTLNMGGIRIQPLALRLQPLVNLLATTPITIALVQEGIGGLGALTADSIVDLVGWMKTAGVSYNFVSRDMTAELLVVYKLGVLTTGQILFSDERLILESTTDWTRQVVVVGIDLPGFGRVDAYTLHLGYDQGIPGFLLQGQRLLQYVADIEAQHGAPALTVIGGDFNITTTPASPHPLYQMLVSAGYVDTYTAVNTDAGNTHGLPGNPYNPGTPTRIDYIFIKGRASVAKSQVVLNQPGTFVSDHSAVLSSLLLQ
jgi:endonuclease/exonuclease/phosphatase family metal-dependent hydrolase